MLLEQKDPRRSELKMLFRHGHSTRAHMLCANDAARLCINRAVNTTQKATVVNAARLVSMATQLLAHRATVNVALVRLALLKISMYLTHMIVYFELSD
jgi:hypothetical protein